MICKVFEPSRRTHNTNAITDLYDLKCHQSMAGAEHSGSIDHLWLQCVGQPSVDVMTNKFYWQVYKLPEIAFDIANYDRMNDFSHD
eukprot:5371022-Heterocapsa_arctica.AAC.1